MHQNSRVCQFIRSYSIGLVLFLSQPARASDLGTWLDSIDKTNAAVIAAHSKWKASTTRPPQAGGWPDPVVGVDWERDSTRFSDYSMIEYMLEQELPWPGNPGLSAEIATLEAEATGFEYLEVRRQTRAAIIAHAWDVWAGQEALAILRQQLGLVTSLEQSEKTRVESGQAAQPAWLRLRIQQDTLQNEIHTMEGEVAVLLARLNAALNSDPATPRRMDQMPALPVLDTSVAKLQEDARQYCCILMATLWRERARDLARKSARREQRPALSLRIEARQMKDSGTIDEYDTGFALNFPWLWNGKYAARRSEAEADYQAASAELQNEINMTLVDIQELFTMAETRLRNIRLFEESILPNTRALAASSRESYATGMMPAMEMIDAQNMLREAEMNYVKEKAAFAGAHARLMAIAQPWSPEEVATGLPVHY